jgi:hypothetical protein
MADNQQRILSYVAEYLQPYFKTDLHLIAAKCTADTVFNIHELYGELTYAEQLISPKGTNQFIAKFHRDMKEIHRRAAIRNSIIYSVAHSKDSMKYNKVQHILDLLMGIEKDIYKYVRPGTKDYDCILTYIFQSTINREHMPMYRSYLLATSNHAAYERLQRYPIASLYISDVLNIETAKLHAVVPTIRAGNALSLKLPNILGEIACKIITTREVYNTGMAHIDAIINLIDNPDYTDSKTTTKFIKNSYFTKEQLESIRTDSKFRIALKGICYTVKMVACSAYHIKKLLNSPNLLAQLLKLTNQKAENARREQEITRSYYNLWYMLLRADCIGEPEKNKHLNPYLGVAHNHCDTDKMGASYLFDTGQIWRFNYMAQVVRASYEASPNVELECN